MRVTADRPQNCVQPPKKLDSPIHRINHYPADSLIAIPNTYLLYSDLSGG